MAQLNVYYFINSITFSYLSLACFYFIITKLVLPTNLKFHLLRSKLS